MTGGAGEELGGIMYSNSNPVKNNKATHPLGKRESISETNPWQAFVVNAFRKPYESETRKRQMWWLIELVTQRIYTTEIPQRKGTFQQRKPPTGSAGRTVLCYTVK